MIFKHQTLITLFLGLCCLTLIQATTFTDLIRRSEPQQQSLTKEQVEEITKKVWEKCGVDQLAKDGEKVDQNNPEEVKEFKHKRDCGLSCVYRELEIVTEDNQLNQERLKFAEQLVDGHEVGLVCGSPLFYEKCSHIKETCNCKYAGLVRECFKEVCKAEKESSS